MIWRVFIIWMHPLFHETVRLLLNHSNIEIVGDNREYSVAKTDMGNLKPDTIIIEDTKEGDVRDESPNILDLLENSEWQPRIIRLSMDDNELRIYRHNKWMMNDSADLIRFIQDEYKVNRD